jgi:hypothetical protein
MSQTPHTAIAVIGIDTAKNSFHAVGPRYARRHRAAAKVVAWPSLPIRQVLASRASR